MPHKQAMQAHSRASGPHRAGQLRVSPYRRQPQQKDLNWQVNKLDGAFAGCLGEESEWCMKCITSQANACQNRSVVFHDLITLRSQTLRGAGAHASKA
eukprot:1152030-Pelagomonas_calceolata.AAC.2